MASGAQAAWTKSWAVWPTRRSGGGRPRVLRIGRDRKGSIGRALRPDALLQPGQDHAGRRGPDAPRWRRGCAGSDGSRRRCGPSSSCSRRATSSAKPPGETAPSEPPPSISCDSRRRRRLSVGSGPDVDAGQGLDEYGQGACGEVQRRVGREVGARGLGRGFAGGPPGRSPRPAGPSSSRDGAASRRVAAPSQRQPVLDPRPVARARSPEGDLLQLGDARRASPRAGSVSAVLDQGQRPSAASADRPSARAARSTRTPTGIRSSAVPEDGRRPRPTAPAGRRRGGPARGRA